MPFPTRRPWSSTLKAAFAAVAGLFTGYGGQGGRGWRFFSPGAQYDYEAQAGDLWRNSAVAACLRVLRANFPEPTLEVARGPRPEDREIEGHALAALIRRPNGYYSRFVLWAATILSLKVDGNAYWLKVRSPAGKVVQLWWVPHWMMEPRYPADGSVYLSHYVYAVNGRQVPIRVEDVVHFRQGLDPRNDRLGLADLKAAVREVCSDNEAAGFAASIMRNSGVPTVVITPAEDGGTFGDGVAHDVREQWRERFTGEGRGEPLVTDSLKVTKIGFSPKELSLGDLPDRFEDRICSLVGVNPMVAGLTSGASHKTFANYAEARRALYEDTIIPDQRCVAEELTDQLLVDFDAPEGAVVRWVYRGVLSLRENENELADRSAMLYEKKLITQNEGRATIGLPPTPGGDRFADGSTPEAEPKTTEGPADGPPTAIGGMPVEDIQAAALNGAQIASLLEIVQQLVAGQLPAESARAVILACFPSLSSEEVESIIGPTESFTPDPVAAPAPATPSGEDPEVKALVLESRELMARVKQAFPEVTR